MKIKQVAGPTVLSGHIKESFETTVFNDLGDARYFVQQQFPNHVVQREGDRVTVSNRDKSFQVAVFKATKTIDKTNMW